MPEADLIHIKYNIFDALEVKIDENVIKFISYQIFSISFLENKKGGGLKILYIYIFI